MGFKIQRPETAFSLDRVTKRRDRMDKLPAHLAYIRCLPCTVCGPQGVAIEAAHVRYASPMHGKPSTAMAQKPPDRWTVPLCATCHRTGPEAQHGSNERAWWENHFIDPCGLAMALAAISGDVEAGTAIIAAVRHKAGK